MKLISTQVRFTYDLDDSFGLLGSEKTVLITYQNGEFMRCDFNFPKPYNRKHWKALAEIERQLKILDTTEGE